MTVRITSIESTPSHRVRYLNARKRGGTESAVLPFLRGTASGLPDGVDALIATSDLQGVVSSWSRGGANVLLGVALCDELLRLAESGELPYPERTGVLLAGDLYSAPGGDVRGATGDVREVWRGFAEAFAWVAGVQGNHDTYGSAKEEAAMRATEGLHLLDDSIVETMELRAGGVGRIIGDPNKPGRRSEEEFLAALDMVLDEEPGVLVLHQGPNGDSSQRGSELVRSRLEQSAPCLVVCGHVHWDNPLTTLSNGTQALNLDSRVVVLTRA